MMSAGSRAALRKVEHKPGDQGDDVVLSASFRRVSLRNQPGTLDPLIEALGRAVARQELLDAAAPGQRPE
jgi:hypothetical protein